MPITLPRLAIAALMVLAAAFFQLGAAAPVDAGMEGIIDVEEAMAVDCDTAQLTGPEAISTDATTQAVTGDPADINLDVQVVVDVAQGAQIAQIADPAERAAAEQALYTDIGKRLAVGTQSYEPLDIALRYDDYALLQPLNADGTPRAPRTTNAQEIIDLAKAQFGGARPAGIDIVYIVTDLDIQMPDIGNAVAGMADCIGGVANPDRAFAVGETGVLVGDEGLAIGPVSFYKDLTAKIAAHEIGHLMGGHHHYQECGTAAGFAVQRGELGPCTLMTNAVDFQTLPFSTLNGAVVRGHAEEFAVATDAPPAEEPPTEEPPAEEPPTKGNKGKGKGPRH